MTFEESLKIRTLVQLLREKDSIFSSFYDRKLFRAAADRIEELEKKGEK